jgi:hypothetical protein
MKILKKLKFVIIAIALFFAVGFASDYFRDPPPPGATQKKFWGKEEYYTGCVAGARIHCVKYYVCWTVVKSNGCPTESCK